jgi:hypothetical protein
MVIGHGRKGMAKVYDQHSYEDEMREALEKWAAMLRGIVTPPSENNVVSFPISPPILRIARIGGGRQ